MITITKAGRHMAPETPSCRKLEEEQMISDSYHVTPGQIRGAPPLQTGIAQVKGTMPASLNFQEQRNSLDLGLSRGMPSIHTAANTAASSEVDCTPIVYVVDDDVSVREPLVELIRTSGWRAEAFGSAAGFLQRSHAPAPSCVVLDLHLPDLSGLELQRRIAADRNEMPVIFLTGHSDVPIAVQAMKAGAIEFFMKPFDDGEILTAIGHALEASRSRLEHEAELLALRERHASLSGREQEVMALVVTGLLNKQVGFELGISEITVKAHRGRVMRKMAASSLADLITMAARLGLSSPLRSHRLAAA
jgi:FixJ family two-component response regulator